MKRWIIVDKINCKTNQKTQKNIYIWVGNLGLTTPEKLELTGQRYIPFQPKKYGSRRGSNEKAVKRNDIPTPSPFVLPFVQTR